MKFKKITERCFLVSIKENKYCMITYPIKLFKLTGSNSANLRSQCLNIAKQYSGKDITPYTGFRSLELIVTNLCNLNCVGCFARSSVSNNLYDLPNASMKLSTAKKAVDFSLAQLAEDIKKNKLTSASFEIFMIGGEPMMNFECMSGIIKYTRVEIAALEKRLSVKINTLIKIVSNGTLLDDTRIVFLKKHKVLLEISVDTPHNPSRFYLDGKSSYQNSLNAVRRCHELGYPVNIKLLVHQKYLHKLDDVIAFLKKDGYLKIVGTIHLCVQGLSIAVHSKKSGCLDVAESNNKLRFSDDPDDCAYYAKKLMLIAEETGLDVKYLRKIISTNLLQGGLCYRCPVAQWKLTVLPGGNVYPCHQLANVSDFFMGNISEKDLLQNKDYKRIVSLFKKRTVFKAKPCGDCLLQTVCYKSADCPARSYHEKRDVNLVAEYSCQSYKPYLLKLFEELLEQRMGEK